LDYQFLTTVDYKWPKRWLSSDLDAVYPLEVAQIIAGNQKVKHVFFPISKGEV